MAGGGKREGAGRKRGSRNWRTIELELKREREIAGDRPLAKEVLEKFMMIYTDAAMQYMPPVPIPEDWEDAHKFHSFAEKAGNFARMLAPYQSATYKSITVQAPRDSVRGTPAIDALEAFVLMLATVRRREPMKTVEPEPEPEPDGDVPLLIEAKANGGG